MPVVKVYGLSAKTAQLKKLRQVIKRELSRIAELELGPDQVSVFFIKDPAPRQSEGIIVEIDGLYKKPERTPDLLTAAAQNLSAKLRDRLRSMGRHFRRSHVVEVFIRTFSLAKGGFAKADF